MIEIYKYKRILEKNKIYGKTKRFKLNEASWQLLNLSGMYNKQDDKRKAGQNLRPVSYLPPFHHRVIVMEGSTSASFFLIFFRLCPPAILLQKPKLPMQALF